MERKNKKLRKKCQRYSAEKGAIINAIIVGRSEFITPEILAKIGQINGTKIVINHCLELADYVAHVDRAKHLDNCGKKHLTLECFDIKNAESYKIDTGGVPTYNPKTNTLKYCGFTHDFVLSWCVIKGFKKILLVGSADFETDGHYDDYTLFNPSPVCIDDSIKYIESLPLKIYTLNPNSRLNIKKITIEEINECL